MTVEKIDIRPLHTSHRSEVEEIVRATAVFNEEEIRVAMEVFDVGRSADYELVGAFVESRLVGYACFGATPATDRTYDLYWIAVRPEEQRTGAGAALMSEVESQLASRGARMLVIETSSRADYAPTRRFYDKRGYREAARLRDFYASGDDRVVLSKRMSATQGPLPA